MSRNSANVKSRPTRAPRERGAGSKSSRTPVFPDRPGNLAASVTPSCSSTRSPARSSCASPATRGAIRCVQVAKSMPSEAGSASGWMKPNGWVELRSCSQSRQPIVSPTQPASSAPRALSSPRCAVGATIVSAWTTSTSSSEASAADSTGTSYSCSTIARPSASSASTPIAPASGSWTSSPSVPQTKTGPPWPAISPRACRRLLSTSPREVASVLGLQHSRAAGCRSVEGIR